MARPPGRPLADQVYGVIPPVPERAAEYGVPTAPPGRAKVEIKRGAGAVAGGTLVMMVSDSDADAVVPRESFTVREAIWMPAVAGVPPIVPLVLIESPLGRPLADHVNGAAPPVASRVVE